MVDPSASRFWQAGLQSGLIDALGLRGCWDAIPPEKRDAPEHIDRRLARQAIQKGLLTLWQAQQLLAGRTSGFKVDRYVLLDLIGHGGMGRVYLARDSRLTRHVALKILAPERMTNPRAIARFQREARVGAQLQHENLVRIYDFGESNGRYFLVMEYIEGKTIGALITSQGPVPPATAARLGRQIALGLEHAHRKGLIHRDVNPYNVMVTHEGTAKLADLGLAIDLAEEERVTREGATVGTFDYVAPEQARHSHSADIRSDIYSLGCSLYHMMAGQVPFPGPSLPEKLFAHQALEPRPLDQVIPGIPTGLVWVVQRMMKKKPEERFASPQEVADALEPFIEDFAPMRDRELSPLIEDLPATEVGTPPSNSPLHHGEVVGVTQGEAGQMARFVPPHAGHVSIAGVSPANAALDGQTSGSSGPLLTPLSDRAPGSEEDIPLMLDLGPEPSLVDSTTRPKAWFGLDKPPRTPASSDLIGPPPTTSSARLEALWRSHPRLCLVLGLVALAVGLSIAWFAFFGPWGGGQVSSGLAGGVIRNPERGPIGIANSKATKNGGPEVSKANSKATIAVLTRDGAEEPAQDLAQAMLKAVGAEGTVVILRNREPLTLSTGDRSIDMSSHRGYLTLRAAEGETPVLDVKMEGNQPFLTTGSGLNLTLEGLTIVVRSAGAQGAPTPPVVRSAGPVRLSRCAFKVADSRRSEGLRAIATDGGVVKVDRCWFEGFDPAFEVHAYAGTKAEFRQTMIVPTRPTKVVPDPAAGRDSHGWGLAIQFEGGGRAGSSRELVLDHCTVAGAGFLNLIGFPPQAPLHVTATACAVKTEALIAWQPTPPDTPLNTKTLQWLGEGNQLDIASNSWIVLSTNMTPALSVLITNLEHWMELGSERQPERRRLRFLTGPNPRDRLQEPSDYAIDAFGDSKTGASPAQVGPRSKPSERPTP